MESASAHGCLNELTDLMVKKEIKQREEKDSEAVTPVDRTAQVRRLDPPLLHVGPAFVFLRVPPSSGWVETG